MSEERTEKFTPGPWRYWRHENKAFPPASQTAVFGSGEQKFVLIAQTHSDGAAKPEQTVEEVIANAHLIAAAPEMYEKLNSMITSIELTMHSIETMVPCSAVQSLAYEIVTAKEILKKARGEE